MSNSSKVYAKDVSKGRAQTVKRTLFGSRKKRWLIGLAVILIIGGIVGWQIWQSHKRSVEAEQTAYTQMIKTFRLLESRKQYSLAEETLQKYLATNPSKKDYRQRAELYLGATELNLKKPKEAIEIYKKALSDGAAGDADIYCSLGMASEANNDTASAINYYKQCLSELKKSKATSAGPRQVFVQGVIDRLEAKWWSVSFDSSHHSS